MAAMFETLTQRLNEVFNQLRRRGKLSQADVEESMRLVRRALLEADVHYMVARDFTARVAERAVGQEVSRALNPGQQVIKIVHEELIATLGEPSPLNLNGPKPRAMLVVGLQGSGKTTTAAKLARLLIVRGERVMLAAADPYRPAAVEQLQTLGKQVGAPVFHQPGALPPELAGQAFEQAAKGGYSALIVDTAGRSQLDQTLMDEVSAIQGRLQPVEILLVVDSLIGQEAVNIATGFQKALPLTGLILTKLDGDARGGAAISIRSVTGIPIKLLGVGEGLDGIEVYDPARLASRILGMGDVLGLIEKAEAALDQETAQVQAEKLISGEFTLQDFADQLKMLRKLGPLGSLMEMIPGQLGQVARQVNPQDAENRLRQTEAIIASMTMAERRQPKLLNASRRRRIAAGAGAQVQEVNQLLRQFQDMQRLMKQVGKGGMKGISGLFG